MGYGGTGCGGTAVWGTEVWGTGMGTEVRKYGVAGYGGEAGGLVQRVGFAGGHHCTTDNKKINIQVALMARKAR